MKTTAKGILYLDILRQSRFLSATRIAQCASQRILVCTVEAALRALPTQFAPIPHQVIYNFQRLLTISVHKTRHRHQMVMEVEVEVEVVVHPLI